jgi:hypothetical protein
VTAKGLPRRETRIHTAVVILAVLTTEDGKNGALVFDGDIEDIVVVVGGGSMMGADR